MYKERPLYSRRLVTFFLFFIIFLQSWSSSFSCFVCRVCPPVQGPPLVQQASQAHPGSVPSVQGRPLVQPRQRVRMLSLFIQRQLCTVTRFFFLDLIRRPLRGSSVSEQRCKSADPHKVPLFIAQSCAAKSGLFSDSLFPQWRPGILACLLPSVQGPLLVQQALSC